MLNKIQDPIFPKSPHVSKIAEEMSVLMPQFIRYMYPHMYKSIDVPPAQIFVLVTVEEEQPCNLTDLSKKLNISAATTSGLVDRLVKRNYLKRVQDQKDRRVYNVNLTKSGHAVIRKFRKNLFEKWMHILERVSEQERMGPLLFIKQFLKDAKK